MAAIPLTGYTLHSLLGCWKKGDRRSRADCAVLDEVNSFKHAQWQLRGEGSGAGIRAAQLR